MLLTVLLSSPLQNGHAFPFPFSFPFPFLLGVDT